MSLRVVALSHWYPAGDGDWKAPFVVARVRALAARCDVTVVHAVPWTDGLPEDEDGPVRVRRARYVYVPGVGKRFDGRLLARAARDAVLAARPDVIEAQFGYPDGEAAVLLAREAGCSSAVVLRGTEQILVRRSARGARLRSALCAADVVLPVSRALGAFAVSLGVPEERIRVVGNGVDTAVFRPGDAAAARAAAGLPADGRLLLGVGHLVPDKGWEDALHALATVAVRFRDAQLVLVGSGPDEARLRARAGELGVARRVLWPGVQPHARIADFLRGADVLVHPSRSEGRPNVVLEAHACGLPAVATDVGGTREILLHARTGYVVPARNPEALAAAVEAALAKPFDRAAVARVGGARSWEDAADDLVAVHRGIAARRRPAAEPAAP